MGGYVAGVAMRPLKWSVYLTVDQLNALTLRLDDEAACSQDEEFRSAHAVLVDAREYAITSEAARFFHGLTD